MEEAAQFLQDKKPDVLVLISPHTARLREEFAVLKGNRVAGDFGSFGFPGISVSMPSDPDAAAAVAAEARASGIHMQERGAAPLDHGALVPLYFLTQAGWHGRTIVVGFPFRAPLRQFESLGRLLVRISAARSERWALVASGDMSHRLKPGAPAGYDGRAQNFDDAIVSALSARDLASALNVDPSLRELAGEDVVESLAVAYGAAGAMQGSRVLSYESPFGVGYLVAILNDPDSLT